MIEEFKKLSNRCSECTYKFCDRCELYPKLVELFLKIRKEKHHSTISYIAEQLDISTIDALTLYRDRDKFVKA